MEGAAYIGGIQRFSTEDGPGIRTSIFLKGCPLRCRWCHNPELLDTHYGVLYSPNKCILCGECVKNCPAGAIRPGKGEIVIDRTACKGCGTCVDNCCTTALHTKSISYTMAALMDIVEKDRDFYETSGGGVTLSGGEVLAHGEYALEIAKEVKKRGFSLAIETSGAGTWEHLCALAEICDWILYDLKHMDPERHAFYTGVRPDLIWENITRLAADLELREKIIIRVPLLHGVNDDEANLEALRDFMTKRHLAHANLLPYHNMGIGKAREAGLVQEEFKMPSDEDLLRAAGQLRAAGIQVEIMGYEEDG